MESVVIFTSFILCTMLILKFLLDFSNRILGIMEEGRRSFQYWSESDLYLKKEFLKGNYVPDREIDRGEPSPERSQPEAPEGAFFFPNNVISDESSSSCEPTLEIRIDDPESDICGS